MACSGLGHVHRGVEAWAEDLAGALHRAGVCVTLFRAAGACEPWAELVPCLRRFDHLSAAISVPLRHAGGWRYGCGSPYEIEQTTFSLGLYWRVRRDFDILHVQDYWIGRHLETLCRRGFSRARVIVGNGTGAHPSEQGVFQYLQHLTPMQKEAWKAYKIAGQHSFLIPNFINTDRFRRACREEARRHWGVPADAFVVFCAAALRSRFKRIDYLIREFSIFESRCPRAAVLLLAGAHEAGTAELISLARELLGDRVIILENVPREKMASLYCTANVFTIPALDEVFGIAFIEAMSCGIPIIAHDTPTMRWVGGAAGLYEDLSVEGGLADALYKLQQNNLLEVLAEAARPHVSANFSETAVVPKLVEMYESVIGGI